MAAEYNWRLIKQQQTDVPGRPPAICLLGHLHHFALDGRSFEVFRGRDRLFALVFNGPGRAEGVKECIVCGAPLRGVEG
jgi:hypothetical protein